jgi:capsular polysaccharide biosynthesis protein
MEEKIVEESSGSIIRELLFMIKRYIVLILAVVILVTGLGIGYSFVRKPNYRASVKAVFQAQVGSEVTYNINAMRAYIDTVIDFCDEGVVIDRANYYYKDWIDAKAGGMSLADYMKGIEKEDAYSEDNRVDVAHFKKENIGISTAVSNNSTQFVFAINYTDETQLLAGEKVQLLLLAYKNELKVEQNGQGKYFSDITIEVKNLGLERISVDVSKAKIAMISALIGAVLALIIAYVCNMADTTIKSKEELERLTDVPVISAIEHNGGKKHGK